MNITEEELTKLINENGLRIINETPARQSVVNVQPIERQNKYHVSAKEDRTLNGIVYASKKEMQKAQELDLMLKGHPFSFYLRQVPFYLGAGITYRADFVLFKAYGVSGYEITVIEVKGMETPAWKLKHKLFKATYPNLTLEVV